MRIINFGSCNIDYVYSVDHIVTAGETMSTNSLELFPGGKGLNQSIAAAKAGAKVYHAGCVGNDSEMLTDILSKSGVDLTYLKTVDQKNGHAIIQVDKNGENCIFLCKGSNEMLTTDFIDSVLSSFTPDDIVLLQNETNNVDYIIKSAYKKGIPIILNPSPFNEALKDIDLNMLTYLILNEVEAKEFCGCDEAKEIIEYMKEHYPKLKIMLTLGKRGCIYSDESITCSHPAYEVKSVDTTAAGDTFTGYFLASIAERKTPEEAIKTASAASALSVSKMGAAPSIPLSGEVYEALKTLVPRDYKKEDKQKKLYSLINTYINENLQNARIEELSDLLGYSEVYTGNVIKKIMNMSFSSLLQEKRCEKAAKLLDETDLSISEIINRIGYENESFFRKIFKEKYGKSPLEYRKEKQND